MTRTSLLFVFLLLTFKLKPAEAPPHTDIWVAWNIGQGQWVTHAVNGLCRHYDAGGEPGSFRKIKKNLLSLCGNAENEIFLSHWDYDHFLNIPGLARSLPRLCWRLRPVPVAKSSVEKILALGLPDCNTRPRPLSLWRPVSSRGTNESSAVIIESHVLLPGDSPVSQEKIWSLEMEGLDGVRTLILGHHGSRTSTGRPLLGRLPALKQAIASARFIRYGHPHPETLRRLSERGVPVLKTEDWGNIWFSD